MATTIRSGPLLDRITGKVRRLAAWRRLNTRDPALREASLRRVERLAWLLDGAIVVPGLRRRIGFDALLGLVPVLGDAAGFVLGGWIVFEAWRLGAPTRLITRMLGNLAIDAGVGAIPIAGDLFDAAWKANQRNAALLRAWLASTR